MTIVCLLLVAGASFPARGEEPPPAKPKTDQVGPAPAPAPPGLKALLDPATGQFTVPERPPASAAPASATWTPSTPPASATGSSANLATSHEGLVAVRGTTRAGGLRVDLKGRFQASVVATVGPDGKVRTECVGAGTKEGEAHAH